MGIPILNELNNELTRLYIAGSPLAKGDPRVSKYIAPLEKLGEKAPVFKALAARLTALTAPDAAGEKASPQNLMEAGMLLQSVLYTQGTTDPGDETAPMEYAEKPLAISRAPYSRLSEMIGVLASGSQSHTDVFQMARDAGQHNDPRLYQAYVDAITDSKSYISSQVEEDILPTLGEEIVPFIMSAFEITGSKRHARLFRVLHKIKGKEALPLAEQMLAEGDTHMVVEALLAMGDDIKYEETLLTYAKDKKGEVRQAAFASLTRLGSAQGEQAVLEGMDKANIGPLEDSLAITRNPEIIAKVLATAKALAENYEKSENKLKVLLRVIASRDEQDALAWLESKLSDAKYFSKAVSALELHQILQILYASKTTEKNQMLLRISQGDDSKLYYGIGVCVRLFDAAEVYDRCHKNITKSGNVQYLLRAYGVNYLQRSDDQRTWDRRWGALLAKAGFITQAQSFLYDDDTYGWKHLLEATAAEVKKHKYYSGYYGNILANAFRLGHPDAKKYFEKFVANGFPREQLTELVNGMVPGAV